MKKENIKKVVLALLRRSGYLHHHSLAEGKLQQLRGRRRFR